MIPPERDVWCINESCPGRADLKQFLDEQLSDVDSESEFHYNQWDIIDWASLTTITITCEDYKDVLIVAIDKSTKHLYLAMCQAQALVVGDFAENYQFLTQGKIQSYHWSKEYCTLYPVVVYFKDDTGSLRHISICFISSDNLHNTCFVKRQWSVTFMNYYYKSKSCFIFVMDVRDSIKITKTSWIFVSTNRTLI